MRQESLNREMVEAGIARYRSKVESARVRGRETDAPYGQRLMRAALPDYINDLRKRILYHKKHSHAVPFWMPLIWELPPQDIAFLSMKSVLDSISLRQTVVKASIRVASALEDEVRLNWMKEAYPEVFKYAIRDVKRAGNKSYSRQRDAFIRHEVGEAKKGNMLRFKTWTKKEKVSMGTWLLELLRATTHFIQFVSIRGSGRKSTNYVSATDDLFDWIRAFNDDQEILSPLWLPMTEQPTEWKSIWFGGYGDPALPQLKLVKSFDMDYLRALDFDELKPMADAVNHIQRTPWTVNDRVLNVARWAWDNNKEIGEMTRREDYERPPWPPEADTDAEVKKEWSRKAGEIYELNLSLRSQRLQAIKTLWMADKFSGKNFYYPSQVDFRGRVYPIPHFLTPQGTDLAKSLLLFAESETVWEAKEETKWLAIHGANCFGNDKITFDERVKWVHSKRKEIHEVYTDPITNDWWQSADEPWQFLAFCFEWGDMLACGGRGFKTRLPCAMDASNNGIQILSLLARDEVGAEATNVTQTDSPADLYAFIADQVNDAMRKDADNGDVIAQAWLSFGVDRKTCKRPVMVKPYGGTRHSCRAYIGEWFNELILDGRRNPFADYNDQREALTYLTAKLWSAMNNDLSGPTTTMKWLQDVARVLSTSDTHVDWTTPTGFKARQRYVQQTAHRIQTTLGEKLTFVRWRERTNDLDKRRQGNGISPNFVHSLDAAGVHMTTNVAREHGITSLAMVHDSYATHCNKCDELGGILRQQFAKIFQPDLLLKFREEVSTQTDKELPELPPYGSLDPAEVLGSDYFFA